VLWRSRTKTITISAKLHDKVAGSCMNMNVADSEVLSVRPVPMIRRRKRDVESRRAQIFAAGT